MLALLSEEEELCWKYRTNFSRHNAVKLSQFLNELGWKIWCGYPSSYQRYNKFDNTKMSDKSVTNHNSILDLSSLQNLVGLPLNLKQRWGTIEVMCDSNESDPKK